MGMGKTVVCAALILANPSTQPPPAASAWHDHQARTTFAARSAGKKTDWQQPPDKVYTWVHGPVVRKHRYNCPLHFQSQYEQCPVHQLPAAHPGPCVCRADAKVDWAIDRGHYSSRASIAAGSRIRMIVVAVAVVAETALDV